MAHADERLRLKKDIEKEHATAKGFSHDDLQAGRWFVRYLERRLASYANAPTPAELKARFPKAETADALTTAVITATVHESLAATDAYEEHLTSHEVRTFKDKEKKNAKPSDNVLVGDSVALVAELLYTIYLDVHLVFQIAAAHSRVLNAAQSELIEEVFGRALGGFDVDKAKEQGELGTEIGKRVYDRAILQCVGVNLADAQRKGFYVHFLKAIGAEFVKIVDTLPAWEAPKPVTGEMAPAAEDDTTFA